MHKSSLPEEEMRSDSSGIRTLQPCGCETNALPAEPLTVMKLSMQVLRPGDIVLKMVDSRGERKAVCLKTGPNMSPRRLGEESGKQTGIALRGLNILVRSGRVAL